MRQSGFSRSSVACVWTDQQWCTELCVFPQLIHAQERMRFARNVVVTLAIAIGYVLLLVNATYLTLTARHVLRSSINRETLSKDGIDGAGSSALSTLIRWMTVDWVAHLFRGGGHELPLNLRSPRLKPWATPQMTRDGALRLSYWIPG